MNQQALNSI